jgi:hypothetical protein
MEEYLIREATENDVAEITELANSYVYDKLSASERKSGFLTGRFELNAMRKLLASATSLVAVYRQELVGFVINSKLPDENYPPLVQTMIQKFPEVYYQNRPLTSYHYFYYGPVLVSKSHRGKGLLPRMFRLTQKLFCGKYDVGVAFIHTQNQNSLNIHTQNLGMEVIGQFSFDANDYYILVFPVC